MGVFSIPGREGGGRSDEGEGRPRAFSSLISFIWVVMNPYGSRWAKSWLSARGAQYGSFGSVALSVLLALSLASLTGSVWRSHDRHYKQEYAFHLALRARAAPFDV